MQDSQEVYAQITLVGEADSVVLWVIGVVEEVVVWVVTAADSEAWGVAWEVVWVEVWEVECPVCLDASAVEDSICLEVALVADGAELEAVESEVWAADSEV